MSLPAQRWSSLWFVWGWPASLSVLTLFGLLAALLGQGGVWLWLSWGALMIPPAAIIACVVRAACAGSRGHCDG